MSAGMLSFIQGLWIADYFLQRLVAAIVLQITFGLTAGGSDDPFVVAMAEAMENLSEVTAPGAYLVDSLPFCASPHGA